MTTQTMNPSAQTLLSRLRPTTLAAIVADLRNEYADDGDPLAELLAGLTEDALQDIVGCETEQMIRQFMEQIP